MYLFIPYLPKVSGNKFLGEISINVNEKNHKLIFVYNQNTYRNLNIIISYMDVFAK